LFVCFAAKIGLFYLIFYSCLAGFFAIMLTGFFTTLSDDHPKQTGMLSLIKGNPGTSALFSDGLISVTFSSPVTLLKLITSRYSETPEVLTNCAWL